MSCPYMKVRAHTSENIYRWTGYFNLDSSPDHTCEELSAQRNILGSRNVHNHYVIVI